jgi:3',5'-cyclic AMP phosphodiesterase CpdA
MRCIYSILLSVFCCVSQAQDTAHTTKIDFVSDTQQPMGVEKIYLKPTQNLRATALIFHSILQERPSALFMLGDIVALGYSNNKWRKVDRFLDSAKREKISVYGVLGNHDVMGRDRKGENNFRRRFPDQVRTGYVRVVDSIAMVLLNSNFAKLSPGSALKQKKFYDSALAALSNDPSIRAIVVACHHPIFTNSTIVKPSSFLRDQYLPGFLSTEKCVLFITGHAHAFEHFSYKGKDFLTIGGGGGLHQPLSINPGMPPDLAVSYKPLFHYVSMVRTGNNIRVTSNAVAPDFSGVAPKYSFVIAVN